MNLPQFSLFKHKLFVEASSCWAEEFNLQFFVTQFDFHSAVLLKKAIQLQTARSAIFDYFKMSFMLSTHFNLTLTKALLSIMQNLSSHTVLFSASPWRSPTEGLEPGRFALWEAQSTARGRMLLLPAAILHRPLGSSESRELDNSRNAWLLHWVYATASVAALPSVLSNGLSVWKNPSLSLGL